jgi:hypothetical protein
MDFIRALTFITEDERWKEKIAMGTVVALVSGMLTVVLVGVLGIFIIMGYSLRLMQNVQRGDPKPLPEWDQWSEDLTRGFKLFIVTLVWSLPAIMVALPIIFGGILTEMGNDAAVVFGASVIMLGACLSMLYGIFLYLVTPAFTVQFAAREQISDGLRVSDVWTWTRVRLGDVIMFLVAFIVASMVISTVGSIAGMVLCFVGLIVTIPLATLLTALYQYHLMGQLAYKARTGPALSAACRDGSRRLQPRLRPMTPMSARRPASLARQRRRRSQRRMTRPTTCAMTSQATRRAMLPATQPASSRENLRRGVDCTQRAEDLNQVFGLPLL